MAHYVFQCPWSLNQLLTSPLGRVGKERAWAGHPLPAGIDRQTGITQKSDKRLII